MKNKLDIIQLTLNHEEQAKINATDAKSGLKDREQA